MGSKGGGLPVDAGELSQGVVGLTWMETNNIPPSAILLEFRLPSCAEGKDFAAE